MRIFLGWELASVATAIKEKGTGKWYEFWMCQIKQGYYRGESENAIVFVVFCEAACQPSLVSRSECEAGIITTSTGMLSPVYSTAHSSRVI